MVIRMAERTSEYAHEVKWALNDLLRKRADQPIDDEKIATRSVATEVGERLASTCVGTNDPVTFARLAELVKFPVGVNAEIEPVDVACAAYAKYIASPEAMEQYTELTSRQFSVLHDSLSDIRSSEETSGSEAVAN